MLRKVLLTILAVLILFFVGSYIFISNIPYSQGVRSGELIKFSRKGVMVKTWEGEISQRISGAQIFSFSVLEQEVIDDLIEFEGKYVKLFYEERYKTFFWWGDSPYFITKVESVPSPHIK